MKKSNKLIATIMSMILFFTPIACLAVYVSDNSIVSFKTPVSADTTKELWSLKLGDSYRNSPCPPTVVNDTVIVMSGKTLYKIDADNGKTLKTAVMADSPSYSYTPVTYANGVIYCPLNNAKIQAFDYKTLKPLWLYSDALGGQSLTEIKYNNGYIYTGFWNDEDEYANYVCLNVKDEDKLNKFENKSASWTYKSLGGFYWAGCTFVGDYVIFGSDDGTVYNSNPSKVMCINKFTGAISDTLSVDGDIRSSVCYYNGKLYFVSKVGIFYSVSITVDGKFDTSSMTKLDLGGNSTSTPVIYNNRAYIGVQGKKFLSGCLKVVDVSKNEIVYTVGTKGYPQSEVLVSDAYYNKTNKINIYLTYNSAPGGITLVEDGNDQTDVISSEIFIPDKDNQNYCISKISVDENGTLFYKNDSGTIFAVSDSSVKINWFQRMIKAIINFFRNLF